MRIQYDESTPLGAARITLAIGSEGVEYETSSPLNQALRISWGSVTAAGTAVLDLSAAAAAFPSGFAAQMRRREMLVLAYHDGGSGTRHVSIPLPVGIPGDAIVAECRSRAGNRWVGEGVPFAQVPGRFGTGGARHTTQVWAFIAVAAVCAFIALILGVWLLALFFNFYALCLYAFVGGGLLFRRGFVEYGNRLAVSGTATAKANSAAIGLCELSGRARGSRPTPAPVTGIRSIYWKADISQWVRSRDGKGNWHTLVKRESDPLDTIELEDETGRIPVWCHRAELILQSQQWRSDHDPELPAPARDLLASIGRTWPPKSDPNHMHITEKRLEDGGPLYVMGTLAECWRVQAAAGPVAVAAAPARSAVRRSAPAGLSAIPGLAWTMLKSWVRQKVRGRAAVPPLLDPQCVLIWRGDQGRPFVVADRPERDTLRSLNRRMWGWILTGAGLMAGALYFFLDAIFS